MAWRVERDCLPRWRTVQAEGYRASLRGRFPKPERFRISCGGSPLGDLYRQVQRDADGSISLRQRLRLEGPALSAVLKERWPFVAILVSGLNLGLEEGHPLQIGIRLNLSPEYRLQRMELGGHLGSLPLRGHAVMHPDGLKGMIWVGEPGKEVLRQPFALPLNPESPVSLGDSPLGRVPNLPVGGAWSIQVVNPLSGETKILQARVEAEERIRFGGAEVSVRRIAIRQSALLEAKVWADRTGRILRQSFLGFEAEYVGEEAIPDD